MYYDCQLLEVYKYYLFPGNNYLYVICKIYVIYKYDQNHPRKRQKYALRMLFVCYMYVKCHILALLRQGDIQRIFSLHRPGVSTLVPYHLEL